MGDKTVGLFCRISPSTMEVLKEALRGMQGATRPGDPKMKLGVLVERCILDTLAPGVPTDKLGEYAGQLRTAIRDHKAKKRERKA